MDKKVITLLKRQCYVDGQWVGEPALPVTNPATGEEIAKVPLIDAKGTKAAIAAAERALPGLVEDAGQGALQHPAPLVQPDDRPRRRAGAADDAPSRASRWPKPRAR